MKGESVMNDLQVFENVEFGSVRTVAIDNEPWFVAVDVCKALEIGNSRQALTRLDDDEKLTTVISNDSAATGKSQLSFVNEPGLYTLVLGSRKAEAKAFKRWITHEVIPSIRKHGAYATSVTIDSIIANPENGIRLLQALKTERDRRKELELENARQKQQLAEYSPKASYYDVVLQTTDALSASEIAKDYGKSAKWLNNLLHEKGIQFKQGGIWLLYQKYAEQGYTRSKTHTYSGDDGKQHSKLHTYWTQKGRLFIYDLLKRDDILPLMEQPDKAGR